MSWQEEYTKRYEARLAENWMPDGSSIPPIGKDGAFTSRLAQYEKTTVNKLYDWGPMTVNQNTREICGND